MRFRKTNYLVTILIAQLLSCTQSKETTVPIKIGMLLDKSTRDGQISLKCAEMVVKRFNADPTHLLEGRRPQVSLIIESSQDGPEQSLRHFHKLVNQEGVLAVIGPNRSISAIPVANAAEKARVPMISPGSTNPKTTAGKHYAFRISYTDDFQGEVMARFAQLDLNGRSAAILFNRTNAYSRGIAEIFRKSFAASGKPITAYVSYTPDNKEFGPLLEEVAAGSPDILFLPNFTNDVIEQARQARALGLKAIILGTDATTPRAVKEIPELQGAYFCNHWHQDLARENPQVQEFLDLYRAEYKVAPQSTGALTYDATVMVLKGLMQGGQANPEALRDGLASLKQFKGVTGKITFTPYGHQTKTAVIVKIDNREVSLASTIVPEQ